MFVFSKTLPSWLVVCMSLAAGGNALAQVSGSASLTGVHYVLTDLDPDDGIAPSLTWLDPGSVRSDLYYGVQTGLSPWGGYLDPIYGQKFSGIDRAFGDDPYPFTFLAYESAQAMGKTDGGRVMFDVPLGTKLDAQVRWSQGFELSANTMVTFSGDLKGTLTENIPAWADDPSSLFMGGYTDLRVGTRMALQRAGRTATAELEMADSRGLPGTSTSRDVDTVLTVSMANGGAQTRAMDFSFSIYATGQTALPMGTPAAMAPVPEPSTMVLAGVGGGLLLAWARRRQRLAA